MLIKVSFISVTVAVLSAAAFAAQQPPAHTGHFNSPPPAVFGSTLGMAMLSATVDANATIVHGVGTTGSSYITTGTYEIDFDRDVSGCTYVSNVGEPQAGSAAKGQSDVAPRSGTPQGVFVETLDSSGNPKDLSFHLIVFCAK